MSLENYNPLQGQFARFCTSCKRREMLSEPAALALSEPEKAAAIPRQT